MVQTKMLKLNAEQIRRLRKAIVMLETPTMNKTAIMTKVKDCKHSVPFKTDNPDAPVSTIYIAKTHVLSKGLSVTQAWDNDGNITFSAGA